MALVAAPVGVTQKATSPPVDAQTITIDESEISPRLDSARGEPGETTPQQMACNSNNDPAYRENDAENFEGVSLRLLGRRRQVEKT